MMVIRMVNKQRWEEGQRDGRHFRGNCVAGGQIMHLRDLKSSVWDEKVRQVKACCQTSTSWCGLTSRARSRSWNHPLLVSLTTLMAGESSHSGRLHVSVSAAKQFALHNSGNIIMLEPSYFQPGESRTPVSLKRSWKLFLIQSRLRGDTIKDDFYFSITAISIKKKQQPRFVDQCIKPREQKSDI